MIDICFKLFNLKGWQMFSKWNKNVFDGQLLLIRPLSEIDISSLQKKFSPHLFKYYPDNYQKSADYVLEKLHDKEKGKTFPWVFLEKETRECIGCSTFSNISFEHKTLEFGASWFVEDCQKKGFNVESKLLLLTYLFEEEKFCRVEFKADELNISSNIAMQKLGFTKEGVFRNHFIMPSGRNRNSVYYSIIDSEWAQVKNIIRKRLHVKLSGNNF